MEDGVNAEMRTDPLTASLVSKSSSSSRRGRLLRGESSTVDARERAGWGVTGPNRCIVVKREVATNVRLWDGGGFVVDESRGVAKPV